MPTAHCSWPLRLNKGKGKNKKKTELQYDRDANFLLTCILSLLNFLSILCEFHINSPPLISVPLYLPSSLATSLAKEKERGKVKGRRNRRGKGRGGGGERNKSDPRNHSVSHAVCPRSVSTHLHLQIDAHCNESWVWFERPLASTTLSILNPHRTPLRQPVVAPCHGDPAALDLQDWPL